MDSNREYTILYIEDENEIRNKYYKYLSRFVQSVYTAKNGEEGYRVYQEKKPDIIIADIEMPILDGLSMCQKIREHDFNTKIILLTAHSDTQHLLQATDLKLTKYLIKPVNREDLKNAISLAIEEIFKFSIYANKNICLKEHYHWDSKHMELSSQKGPISLTKYEKLLTNILVSKLNKVFTYEEIIYYIWPDDYNDKLPALKTLVKSLRRKLPEDSIENIRSIGYKFLA